MVDHQRETVKKEVDSLVKETDGGSHPKPLIFQEGCWCKGRIYWWYFELTMLSKLSPACVHLGFLSIGFTILTVSKSNSLKPSVRCGTCSTSVNRVFIRGVVSMLKGLKFLSHSFGFQLIQHPHYLKIGVKKWTEWIRSSCDMSSVSRVPLRLS